MVGLRDGFALVLRDYEAGTAAPFSDHPTANFIRRDLAESVADAIPATAYLVVGSAGQGNWAEVPWVSIFDEVVTTSAQRGYYVVYLFDLVGQQLFLSLNQGTVEVRRLADRHYREVLAQRAETYGRLLGAAVSGLALGPIDLHARRWLGRGYESGSVASIRYGAGELPEDDTLAADLGSFLELYGQLIEAVDATTAEAEPGSSEEGQSTALEGARRRWHQRIESSPALKRRAKRFHGSTCQVCGFNFGERYGEIGLGYIEAHHLVPLSELAGRPRELDPQSDFAVVCPNCHRMLHTSTPPLLLADLRGRLR
jgi:5-methylcytosine-specific restriction protein A